MVVGGVLVEDVVGGVRSYVSRLGVLEGVDGHEGCDGVEGDEWWVGDVVSGELVAKL